MVELVVLGSGSKGNCTFIRTADGALLVDAGLSARQTVLRLQAAGFDPGDLDGVLLTHEHRDHTGGLRVLTRRFPMPVLANRATLAAASEALEEVPEKETVATGVPFTLGGFDIASFAVSHDAAEPVGYVFEAEGIRVGYATDLGTLTPEILSLIHGCHIVVLEANHDLGMLWNGSYPWVTKERIASELGHLDNVCGAAKVASLAEGGMAHLVLAHLSENNNDPRLVQGIFREALDQAGSTQVQVTITSQREASRVLRL